MRPFVDLFSGSGSSTRALSDRGHEVLRIDLSPPRDAPPGTLRCDVFDIAKDPAGWFQKQCGGIPRYMHLSPVCTTWAVGAVSTHWRKDEDWDVPWPYRPRSDAAVRGVAMLEACLHILDVCLSLEPEFLFTMENPAGMMHKYIRREYPGFAEYHENLISYCQYGAIGPVDVVRGPPVVRAQKNTIIWTNLSTFDAKRCLNRPPRAQIMVAEDGLPYVLSQHGIPCHEQASRGWVAGVQRIKGDAQRGHLPYGLSSHLADCVERELDLLPPSDTGRGLPA